MRKTKREYEPWYWANEWTRLYMSRGYLLPGVSVEERVRQIARRAEALTRIEGFAEKFERYMARGWYSLATPIWANYGLGRGLPISCYGTYVEDDTASILRAVAEIGMMSKQGGGTSVYLGNLRPPGAPIRDNGESNGSYAFASLFDRVIEVFNQGSTRRGQCAAYIPIEHPDFPEWLRIQREGSEIQSLFWGVTVGDAWLEAMVAGDREKRERWAQVLKSRAEVGIPYIFFRDNANRARPEIFKRLGVEIHGSNLCVVGSSLAVTSEGIRRVEDLYREGKPLTLFDGEKPVPASPMYLIERDADVYTIITKSGRRHTVTGYHKVKTQRGMVPALELKPGDKIAIQRNEGLFGSYHNPDLAFLLGLYHGDGTQTDKQIFIDLWEHDFDLKEKIEACVERVYLANGWDAYEVFVPSVGTASRRASIPRFYPTPQVGKEKKLRLGSTKLKQLGFEKFLIPDWIWQGDKETQAAYLKGLFYADGTVRVGESEGNPVQLALASVNKEFLRQVQIILTNLGINSRIYKLFDARNTLLPDGRGGHKEYPTKDSWRLVIGDKNSALKFEDLTGFLSRKGVHLERREYRDNTKKWDEVVAVEYAGKEDVYCCTVYTDEHVWVCDGIITSNCSEIALPSTPEESFVCCLSSLNLLHFDEWKDTDAVETLTIFLDSVLDDFIEKAQGIPYMERAVRFARRYRAIGIGVLGWHSYLQSKGIPLESADAVFLNGLIFKTILERAEEASRWLRARHPEDELAELMERRNATLMAVAPTKSSSFILGQVSPSIEPYTSNYYLKDLQKARVPFKNPFLEELLRAKGKDEERVWRSILEHNGSVQHLDFLTDEEKDVFKTFAEVSQKTLINLAAGRQRYIDQGQSLNLVIHPEAPPRDVNELYLHAWRSGLKALYYQFSSSTAQAYSRDLLLSCRACEG
ncbi:LAGLIDADG family homing endonuclease [Thermus sp.]|uniref:LAGLIDADG family homing endonuclease n=1 Tax=Thermus sp. TaxID=275 RepID=UPI0025F5F442|nr:LAGLIDADG family homing endonuclease [Thermus sp.]MCS6867915.1 ribonucleoside-diphosphate reductase [Thermus sp.]